MTIPTGIRKKESERRKILWKNMKWMLLIDPSFQYGDNFSRLDLSQTDMSFIWCYLWCVCFRYMQQRNSMLRLVKSVPSSVILTLWIRVASIFARIHSLSVFSHLKRGSHLLLPRTLVNLRLSLLFLRHPLASCKGMHVAVEKGEQLCLDFVCTYIREDTVML